MLTQHSILNSNLFQYFVINLTHMRSILLFYKTQKHETIKEKGYSIIN